MKKILLSLSAIVAVAGVVAGGTFAFYNDTEASNGNIFVAGSIDLKVDHTRQTYNGVDCETCSLSLWSSSETQVINGNGAYAGPFPIPAVPLTFIHPGWLTSIPSSPAQWIWVTDPVLQADTENNAEYTFQKKFYWNGAVEGITLELAMIADNGYKVVLNGVTVQDVLGTEFNYGALVDTTVAEVGMLANIQNGENVLEITVRNKAQAGSNPQDNPAGLIYNLDIQRTEEDCLADTTFQRVCRLWSEKDLGQGDTFFNFDDVKPADSGTNVISLHVSTNDAYACLIVNNKDDQENPPQPLDPELDAGDVLGVGNPSGKGELSSFLNVFTWGDTNADGVYNVGETSLGSGPLSSLSSIMSMDSINDQFLMSTTTKYIGLAWCAGTLTPNQGNPFGCDGAGMSNIAQSDSFTATLTAYAEQVRNNATFECEDVNLPDQILDPQEN